MAFKREENIMRILLTGGGTAGHVTPNLALIPRLEEMGFDIQYIGRKAGIEKDLISQTNIPYYAIQTGKLRRYFDFKNLTDIFSIFFGFIKALFLVRKIRPRLVFSKGGFVSCPVVWAAWLNRIPVITHESDITPGLANRLSIPFSKKICFSFPETEAHLPKDKAVLTGIPIREMLLNGKGEEGRKICGFNNSKPVLLVVGGSQGAEEINKAIRSGLDDLSKKYNVCHICGQGGVQQDFEENPYYAQFEYVETEMPHFFAMADVVVSRAGATTLFEFLALKKPSVLVPLSLKASRGDQLLNAESFEKQGFSLVVSSENLNSDTLIDCIETVYSKRTTMAEAMDSFGSANGLDNVLNEILKLVNRTNI